MSHKILVADDSLTVQKVVSITLASYDYEIVECKDESQLNEQLMIGGAGLLLLDLNLSESKSGYELAKEVKSKFPALPIILLLGTFDSVDEGEFSSSGMLDRIVKPFESNTFIQKVQGALEAQTADESGDSTIFSGETETNFLSSSLEDVTPETEETDIDGGDWVVDSPAPVDNSSESWDSFSQGDNKNSDNALEASLEGWGMNVPGPIGGGDGAMEMDLPGVIGDKVNEQVVAQAVAELDIVHEGEKKIPAESDLDYPDVGEVELKEQSITKEVDHQPTSAIMSSDEFNLDVDGGSAPAAETEDLAATIETEEEDDFWAADDGSQSEPASVESLVDELDSEDEGFHAEPDAEQSTEIVEETSISLEPLGDPRGNEPFEIKVDEPKPSISAQTEVDTDAIVNKILDEIKPLLSDLVEKHCKETIENVAWQIIPDLAENLIRSEIKEIKENSQSL